MEEAQSQRAFAWLVPKAEVHNDWGVLSAMLPNREKDLLAGTTPASGTPRKKRDANSPPAFWLAAIHAESAPKPAMIIGRKCLPDIFFMRRFEGRSRIVVAKYVIEMAQLKTMP